jgi:SagB-type dehydrogenase family enzyme
MKTLDRKKYLTRISYDLEDLSLMETFHESTKFFADTVNVELPRIIAYMTEQRAMLETSRNRKLYRYSPKIALPAGSESPLSLESCLSRRRSAARFSSEAISLETLSSILQSAMGPTQEQVLSAAHGYSLKKRPYASGGALYPVEVYPILLNVEGLPVHITHYDPLTHSLDVIDTIDPEAILGVCNDVGGRLSSCGVIFILTAVLERTTIKYGQRGYRFALLEAGQLAQNLTLCAVSHRLGSLPWGGYLDDDVADLLKIDNVSETVMHCLAVGGI